MNLRALIANAINDSSSDNSATSIGERIETNNQFDGIPAEALAGALLHYSDSATLAQAEDLSSVVSSYYNNLQDVPDMNTENVETFDSSHFMPATPPEELHENTLDADVDGEVADLGEIENNPTFNFADDIDSDIQETEHFTLEQELDWFPTEGDPTFQTQAHWASPNFGVGSVEPSSVEVPSQNFDNKPFDFSTEDWTASSTPTDLDGTVEGEQVDNYDPTDIDYEGATFTSTSDDEPEETIEPEHPDFDNNIEIE